MSDIQQLNLSLAAALDRADPNDRWTPLASFVASWYRKPLRTLKGAGLKRVCTQLQAVEQRLGAPLPTALREWYLLVGDRLEAPDAAHPIMNLEFNRLDAPKLITDQGWVTILNHLEYLEPYLYLDASFTARGDLHEPLDLVATLTSAVVWQTLHCVATECFSAQELCEPVGTIRGPLGSLHRTARGKRIEPLSATEHGTEIQDENGVTYLTEAFPNAPFQPLVAGDETIEFVGAPGGEIVIAIRSHQGKTRLAESGSLGRSNTARVNSVCRAYERNWQIWEQAERQRRAEAKQSAEQALLQRVPESDPAILEALEALAPVLLRFEKSFVEDFRLYVSSERVTPGQRLQAAKVLTKAR